MESAAQEAGLLQGMRVAFTGKLTAMSRSEAARLVQACGGEVITSVSRDVSLLVIGDESGPLAKDGRLSGRIRKAKHLQRRGHRIVIVSETEFLRRCGLESPDESVRQQYTSTQVCRILKLSPDRLSRWIRSGLVEPIKPDHAVPYFDYRQVSWAKTLCNLTRQGVKPDKIRRSLRQLKYWLATEQPLAQLALLEQDGELLVRLDNGQLAEPSGQPRLNFGEESEPRTEQKAPICRAHASMPPGKDWFAAACQMEDEERWPEAVDAYRQALQQNGPDAITCFNLANVLYQLGQKEEAVERYQQAIEIDPVCAPAWNNLGNLHSESGNADNALRALTEAVRLDPSCADYRYNLADLLDELGRKKEARVHWRFYLQTDVQSSWAQHARQRLRAIS
jgi:tetratricopeptide (TPR) repeat protein